MRTIERRYFPDARADTEVSNCATGAPELLCAGEPWNELLAHSVHAL
jgi:hypothetical protein